MFKNREFKNLVYVSIAATVVMLIIVLAYLSDSSPKETGKVYVFGCVGILAMYIVYVMLFTIKRYKKLQEMSGWLHSIQNRDNTNVGEYIEWLKEYSSHKKYEFSDYIEGELSILQSEAYKLTTQLIELNEKLINDKKYLADTLWDISHQLKTPMTSMLVMADLLADEKLPKEKREEFTKSIQNQLERMEWLLQTLLKMSKLDAGTLKLTRREVNLSELVDKATEHLIIPMELRNQTLSISEDEKCKGKSYALLDKNWTAEAVSNVVKNCVEHTGENGRIDITYGENAIYSYIIIKDNGVGICKEDISHIFERFYKGKNARKDSIGIGLAFAKQIINMQNGQISVQSVSGEGSVFTIKFYRGTV